MVKKNQKYYVWKIKKETNEYDILQKEETSDHECKCVILYCNEQFC